MFICLSRNPNTPPKILKELLNSDYEEARRGAIKNPNTPKRSIDLSNLSELDSHIVRHIFKKTQDPSASVGVQITEFEKELRDLVSSSHLKRMQEQLGVVSHKALVKSLLELLKKEKV